jgi:hypothetical protein
MLTGLDLTDIETYYKVFGREILEKITFEEDRFGFDPEITAKIANSRSESTKLGFLIRGERITYKDKEEKSWLEGWFSGNLLYN